MSSNKRLAKQRRHRRVRKKVSGTAERPRLSVYKSNKHIHVQAIDDIAGETLASATSNGKSLAKGTPIELATDAGKSIGEALKSKGIEQAVFDRGGFRYHGRVAAVAEGAREAGLKV